MIILDRIDPAQEAVQWTLAAVDLPGTMDRAVVEARMRGLGICRVRELANGLPGGFEHSWSEVSTGLEYGCRLSLNALVPRQLAFYTAAALATATWAPQEALAAVHLTLYELGTNLVDHGRELPHSGGLTLRLCLERDRLAARLTDGCVRFDPPEPGADAVRSRARRRERRGYGVALIRAAVDRIRYDFGPQGNVVELEKGIPS